MDELANIYGRYLSQGSRVLAVGCLNDPQAQTLAIHRLASLPPPANENEKNRLPQTLLNSPHWPLAEVILIPNLNQVGRLNTLPELLQEIARGNKQLLFSWNFPPIDHAALQREFASLEDFLAKHGLLVQASQQLPTGLLIKAVAITWPQSLPLKKVAILSYGNINNFGDRLGLHLISRLLPAHAVTKHLFFSPMEVSDETFDLLILGIGNSLFRQVLTPHLLELMNRCQQTVGIFGTQYRSEIDTTFFHQLLDRLTCWWARYQDDLLLYGRNHPAAHHLGDWLIAEFPLAESHRNGLLKIEESSPEMPSLDVAIRTIQEYRQVYSCRIHPFLCALTSARQVAYEDRIYEGIPTGKFHSLLMDVFGQVYPEKTFFNVDRQAVVRYRHHVLTQMALLEKQLHTLLAPTLPPGDPPC